MKTIAVLLVFALASFAHEGGKKNTKPTAAQKDLNEAKSLLGLAKKELSAQGKYSCCVKPGCDMCPMTRGACSCAENAKSGRGVCGECMGGWKAGRGSVKGVSAKSVKLEAVKPEPIIGPPDLLQAVAALLRAKRILVTEQRYSCCIRGGCGQCAHEAECPCARDLGATPRKGVCGHCVNGWQAGEGRLDGISPDEVTLAAMDDATPMEMLTTSKGPWNFSLHGGAFGIYTAQTGPRGRDKIFSTNMFMPTASRRLGPGTLTIRSMFSLEPATITSRQYPLLFQEGETAFGVPIVNGQHPHDLFMELAASYRIPLGERASLNFYGGPRGQPALGPEAYMHRLSASENPIAPLGHHQQDSTHIATDVITAGFSYGPVTLEASAFHAREPDEFRWGIEHRDRLVRCASHRDANLTLVGAVLDRQTESCRSRSPTAAGSADHRVDLVLNWPLGDHRAVGSQQGSQLHAAARNSEPAAFASATPRRHRADADSAIQVQLLPDRIDPELPAQALVVGTRRKC